MMAVIKVLRRANAFVGMILYQKDQNQDHAARAHPVKDYLPEDSESHRYPRTNSSRRELLVRGYGDEVVLDISRHQLRNSSYLLMNRLSNDYNKRTHGRTRHVRLLSLQWTILFSLAIYAISSLSPQGVTNAMSRDHAEPKSSIRLTRLSVLEIIHRPDCEELRQVKASHGKPFKTRSSQSASILRNAQSLPMNNAIRAPECFGTSRF